VLFWLGHDAGVCFGVEYSGPELNNRVRIDENGATVGELLERILGRSYQISTSEGVVLIRKKNVSPPSWLDKKIREFTMPEAELMMTDARLWMELELSLDKTKHGFGGDSPESSPPDEIGPFNERNRTIRELLVKIVSLSHGAAWFPTNSLLQTSFDLSVNRFWTLATYSTRNLFRPE
jgi:hypothetical protein